jgi:hypothetical protein
MRVIFFVAVFLHGGLFAFYTEGDMDRLGFRKVSHSPLVYECENFLSEEECDHIIEKARPELARSTVVDLNSSGSVVDSSRTSLGMFIFDERDPVIFGEKWIATIWLRERQFH